IARTVASMSTTMPFFTPVEGAIPTARISTPAPFCRYSAPGTSPTTAHTFVVPMSSPTMISLLATNHPSLQPLPADEGEVEEDPPSQRHDRRQVEIRDANLIPKERQQHGEHH